MRARKLFHYKATQGAILVEMIVWALSCVTMQRPHGLKYRLHCGRGSECIVRYDNETGKGDHRHYGDCEEPYRFESVERLIEDFRNDCTRLSGWRWTE
jgi:hypothetical protein